MRGITENTRQLVDPFIILKQYSCATCKVSLSQCLVDSTEQNNHITCEQPFSLSLPHSLLSFIVSFSILFRLPLFAPSLLIPLSPQTVQPSTGVHSTIQKQDQQTRDPRTTNSIYDFVYFTEKATFKIAQQLVRKRSFSPYKFLLYVYVYILMENFNRSSQLYFYLDFSIYVYIIQFLSFRGDFIILHFNESRLRIV